MSVETTILIRPLEPTDAAALARLANNKNIQVNLRNESPYPYLFANAIAFIDYSLAKEQCLYFAIEFEGLFAGLVSIQLYMDGVLNSGEVGYWVGEPFWGKGIATQVVNSITRLGFTRLQLSRIFAGVFEWNRAGMRVLEKCGFQLEGISYKTAHKNGQLVDEYWYGLSTMSSEQ